MEYLSIHFGEWIIPGPGFALQAAVRIAAAAEATKEGDVHDTE